MITDWTAKALRMQRLRARLKSKPTPSPAPGPIIGYTENNGGPVCWPLPDKIASHHSAILASSGSGKTALLGYALVSEIIHNLRHVDQDSQTSLLVVDPKSDLITIILQGICALAPELLAERVIYLNPFEGMGFNFNLNHMPPGNDSIEIRAMQVANLCAEVSSATGSQKHLGAIGPRQADCLYNYLLAALDTDQAGANVLLAYDGLQLRDGAKRLAAITNNRRAREYLLNTKLDETLKVSSASRLRSCFSLNSDLERLVTSPGCIDWQQFIGRPGTLTLVDLGHPPGGLTFLQRFYACLIVRTAIEHALARESPWPGHICRICIDEFAIILPVLEDLGEYLYTVGRSKGLVLTVVAQGTTPIQKYSDTLLRNLLNNCQYLFAGRMGVADSEILAKEIAAPRPGVTTSIGQLRARKTTELVNLADRHFIFNSPGKQQRFRTLDIDFPGWQQAAEEHAELLDQVRNRFRLAPDQPPRLTLVDLNHQPKKPSRSPGRQGRSPWG